MGYERGREGRVRNREGVEGRGEAKKEGEGER